MPADAARWEMGMGVLQHRMGACAHAYGCMLCNMRRGEVTMFSSLTMSSNDAALVNDLFTPYNGVVGDSLFTCRRPHRVA